MAANENAELEELIRRAVAPAGAEVSTAPAAAGFAQKEDDDDESASLDLATLVLVARRSLLWMMLLIGLGITASWLYLRYTKPVFKSLSLLKIDERSDANDLGLGKLTPVAEKASTKLAGEVELIKSGIIYRRLKDLLALDVNYYAQGTVLENEMYGSSPFTITYKVTDPNYYNRKFNLDFTGPQTFKLAFVGRGRTLAGNYRLEQPILSPGLELVVHGTPQLKAWR